MTSTAKRPVIMGTIALAVLILGAGFWSFTVSLAGAIIAPGRIDVAQNRQAVQHPDGGVISEILVENGQFVQAGTILLTLEDTLISTQLSVKRHQWHEVLARRARLIAERDGNLRVTFAKPLKDAAATAPAIHDLLQGQTRLFEARKASLFQDLQQLSFRHDQIDGQLDRFETQEGNLLTQSTLLKQQLAAQTTLFEKGLTSAGRVLDLQTRISDVSGRIGQLHANRAQALAQKTEFQLERTRLRTAQREEAITKLRDLMINEMQLKEEVITLEDRLAAQKVTAPIAGIVHGLNAHAPKTILRPADPILSLVPQDRPFIFTIRVTPTQVGQVQIGQDAELRLVTFDQENVPDLSGQVTKLSADVFDGQGRTAPYYVAEIQVTSQELQKLPSQLRLLPGMPVQAFLKTNDQSPISYLTRPITNYFIRALRES